MAYKYRLKRGNLEVRVIKDKCIGAAVCVVVAPQTFDLDEENIAFLKEEKWDDEEKIIQAAEGCPVLAIEVYKDGKKIFPKD